MDLKNTSYEILLSSKNASERYIRDPAGWLKISSKGRKFRMTAEQMLNHLLPVLSGLKPNMRIKVKHLES